MRRTLAIGFMATIMVGCWPATTPDPNATTAPSSVSEYARWAEFVTWQRGDFQTTVAAFNTLEARTAANDADGAVEAGRALERSASGHLQYLASHPPAPCYANLHALMLTGMTHMKDLGSAAAAADYEKARAEAKLADAAWNQAAGLIPATDADCKA